METEREKATPGTEAGGLLLVDKPAGITSHDAVAIVRRATRTRRVGHTGTLDPFATGLLVILLGRGTRLIPYVEGEPKIYEATIRFGTETDTDDATGTPTRSAALPTDEAIAAGIASLTGELQQVPPDYSAKQVEGTRAYAVARRGTALELRPVAVTVHEWVVTRRRGADLAARITCGGGTYIRSLARDLGRLTNSAAHLAALRRTHSGPFSVDSAVTLDQLSEGAFTLRPLHDAVPSMPVQQLDAGELGRVGHGNPVGASTEGARVALLDDEQTLIAVAERVGDELRPRLVLRDV
jgi:tRNA pseudouridine55 synthase